MPRRAGPSRAPGRARRHRPGRLLRRARRRPHHRAPVPAAARWRRCLARRRLPRSRCSSSRPCGALARRSRPASASALAFNYFHIPPTGRFTIAESENWVALVVFLIAAVIGVASPTSRAQPRARGRPAAARGRPGAELARLLLRGTVPAESLRSARGAADRPALSLPSAAIQLGAHVEGDEQHGRVPAAGRDDPSSARSSSPPRSRRRRCAACTGGSCRPRGAARGRADRDRLLGEVVETQRAAPRRRVKTPCCARSPTTCARR